MQANKDFPLPEVLFYALSHVQNVHDLAYYPIMTELFVVIRTRRRPKPYSQNDHAAIVEDSLCDGGSPVI
jgi:hypothetical protein